MRSRINLIQQVDQLQHFWRKVVLRQVWLSIEMRLIRKDLFDAFNLPLLFFLGFAKLNISLSLPHFLSLLFCLLSSTTIRDGIILQFFLALYFLQFPPPNAIRHPRPVLFKRILGCPECLLESTPRITSTCNPTHLAKEVRIRRLLTGLIINLFLPRAWDESREGIFDARSANFGVEGTFELFRCFDERHLCVHWGGGHAEYAWAVFFWDAIVIFAHDQCIRIISFGVMAFVEYEEIDLCQMRY